MSVLVTGAAGNIGSNIVRTLLSEGEQVIGYDTAPPPPHSVVYPMLRKFPFVLGSVVDLPLLLNTIKQYKVQDVIHLAAIMMGAKERPLKPCRSTSWARSTCWRQDESSDCAACFAPVPLLPPGPPAKTNPG
jgi:hypothetical protein